MKKTSIRKLLIFTWAALPLTSCVKDDLHHTPHPDKGCVEVTTDWSGASSDAVLPQSYLLRIGTQEQAVSGVSNAFPALFEPGIQDLLVYHEAEGITIDGSSRIAAVNTLADGTLEPLPGYLFSAARKLEIAKDNILQVDVQMQQHVRRLTLILKLAPGDKERIAAVSAKLTGIASAVSLTDGTVTSTVGKTVGPTFVFGTDDGRRRSAGESLLAATLRLLDVAAGEKQTLTLDITLTDSSIQTVTTDLTDLLRGFGTGDKEPLELNAALRLPTEGNFTATITGWTEVDNGKIEIK